MKTKIILSLAIALTAALEAQPTLATATYVYTGNPFTTLATGPYTMTWVESSVVTVCVVVTVVSRVVPVCANANGAMNAQVRMIAIVFIRFSLR